MADATGHIRVETILDQSLQAGLNSLSASIGATTGKISALNSVSKRLNDSSRGVTNALKLLSDTERGVYTISQSLAVSQITLANHFRQVRQEANLFNTVLRTNSKSSKDNAAAISRNIAKVRELNAAQKALNRTLQSGAMMDMSRKYNKQATEMSYVGQRLTMGLTLPLMAIGRIGFSSLKKLDQEMVRTRKLLNDTGTDSVFLENQMKVLGDRLDKISFKFGVSRELLQGLAGDFAELGISSPHVLANLVQITNEIEKLGNVDMTQANELTRSIYQNLLKLRRVNDQDVTSDAALKSVTQQVRGAVALFNFAENKTSLSLKDIAQAFPEVQAAATTFGLSMQTTAALLVPMVSAGIKTGTAANALKVSLQKLIIPTRDVRKIYAALNQELGPNFATSMDIGTKGIQQLVDSFIELEKSSYGTQGTLQLFAKAFGVRQGTRMDLSIQQFAAFQKQIEKTDEAVQTFDGTMGDAFNPNARGSVESQLLSSLEKEINAQLRLAKIDEIRIRNIKEIGDINEMATETEQKKNNRGEMVDVFTTRAKSIQAAQEAMLNTDRKRKLVNQQINMISTESGKILIGGAIGQGLMADTMEAELKAVEGTLNVQAGKVREAFKSIARDVTVAFGGILSTIGPILQKVAIFVKDLSPGTKKLIGFFAIFLLSLGPLVRAFGLFKQAASLATFGMAKGMLFGRSRAMELNEELLRVNNTFLKLGKNNAVSEIGGKLVFRGKRKVFNRAQELVSLQGARDPDATGIRARFADRKIDRLERRLGISAGTQANFTGLKPETAESLQKTYSAQATLLETTKKAIAAAQDSATKNKATSLGQISGTNNPLRGVYTATTQALNLIKDQSLVSPQTFFKKTRAGVAAATQKASAKVSADPFMKTILNAIKSLLQEIAKCTCAKSPLAAGKNAPALGAVSSRGSPVFPPPAQPAGSTGMPQPQLGTAVFSPGAKPAPVPPPAKSSPTVVTDATGPIVAAGATMKQSYVELLKTSRIFEVYDLSLKDVIAEVRHLREGVQSAIKNNYLNESFAMFKTISQDAVVTKVLLEKYGLDINKILDEYRQAVVNARNNLVAGARATPATPTQNTRIAKIIAANLQTQQPLTQTRTGSTGSMFGMPANLLAGLQSVMAKAVVNATKSATNVVGKALPATGYGALFGAQTSASTKQEAANLSAAVKPVAIQDRLRERLPPQVYTDIKEMGFNMKKATLAPRAAVEKASFEFGKTQLLGMFEKAGQAIPNSLASIPEMLDAENKKLRLSLDQIFKLFNSISTGKFTEAVKQGPSGFTKEAVYGMLGKGASQATPLNKAFRQNFGGATRVAPGTGTYLDLRKEQGKGAEILTRRGYQDQYNARRMDPENLGSLITRTGRIAMNARMNEDPIIPIDRRANNQKSRSILSDFDKRMNDGTPSHTYSAIRREEFAGAPGRHEKLLGAPVGFKEVKVGEQTRQIPTNITKMRTGDYIDFARMRQGQIDVAKAVSQAVTNLNEQRSAIISGLKEKGFSTRKIAESLQLKNLGKIQIKERLGAITTAGSEKARNDLVARTSYTPSRPATDEGDLVRGGGTLNPVTSKNVNTVSAAKRIEASVNKVATGLEEERALAIKRLTEEGSKASEKALSNLGLSRVQIKRRVASADASVRTNIEKEVVSNLAGKLAGARNKVEQANTKSGAESSLTTAVEVLKKDIAPLEDKAKEDKAMRIAQKTQRQQAKTITADRASVKKMTASEPERLQEISKIESIVAKERSDQQKATLSALKKEQKQLQSLRTKVQLYKERGAQIKKFSFMSDAEKENLKQMKGALTKTNTQLNAAQSGTGVEAAKENLKKVETLIANSGLSQSQQDRLMTPVPAPVSTPRSTKEGVGVGYLPQPKDIVGTPVGQKPVNVLPQISSAQQAFNNAQVRLANLMGVKTALKQPPNPYASEADVKKVKTDLEAKLKALKLGKESLDSAIQKAQATLAEAKQKLAASLAPKAGGGGGAYAGGGETSMVTNQMLGMPGPMLDARARLIEKFGPKMPTMTTGSTAGSSSTVFDEIQKALKIPGDVMKQVKDNLTNGFKNAEGVARGAQEQVVNVGNASRAEIKGSLDALIAAIKLTGTGANNDILAITEAIRTARGAFGKIEKATPGLAARRLGEAAPAAVAATPVTATATKTVNPFDNKGKKATAPQIQQIANLLTQHNMEVAELQNLDSRTLRKLVETFKNTNESLKGGVAGLGNAEKAQALVNALNNNQKSFITLQEVYTRVLTGTTQAANQATTEVKTQVTASTASLKIATEVIIATAKTSGADVSNEKIILASNSLKTATVKAVMHPALILAQIAQKIVEQQAALPSVTAVAPVVNQVPGAVKVLDNAAADHVTKLAEMMRRAAGQLSATPLGFAGAQQLVQNLKSTTSGAVSGRRPPPLNPLMPTGRPGDGVKYDRSVMTVKNPALSGLLPSGFPRSGPSSPLGPSTAGQLVPANFAPAIAKFNIKASQVAASLAKINPRSVLATVAPASVATQRAGAMIEANRPGIANFAVPGRTPAFDPSGVLSQIKSVVTKSLIVPPKVASIADIPIPKRGSARSYNIPEPPKLDKLTKLNSFVGKLVAITSRVTSSRAAQVLDAGGAGLMPGLAALKSGLLAPLFQRQNRFVPTDYYGAAKERMSQAQIRRGVDPTTPRQVSNIQKEASREGAVMRGIDRPNERVRMMQGRLPSQFIQSISPMLNQFRAIKKAGVTASDVLRDFAPRIYKASVLAGTVLKKSAPIAARIGKELVKFPLTANVAMGRAAQIITTALAPSARTLADSLRSVGTKISGAVQKGFVSSGVAQSSPKAARVLEVAGKTLSFSVQTAFSMVAGSLTLAAMAIQSPRQVLSQGIASVSGVFTRTATAVKGSLAKLAAAGGGTPLGIAKAVATTAAKGAFSLAAKPVKAVGGFVASQVQQSRPYMAMMGGPVVKADDGTSSKKGGFFTASKTYNAQGDLASKTGGFAKNMAAVPFNAIAGGMRMIGGATSMAMGSVSSLGNMMLYKLGPAGFLLMPILAKVTAGLQAMGARALFIILPLLTIFAIIKIVKKGWASFNDYTTTASKNFKKVKEVFKSIIDTIKSIFFDFFATLFGAGKDKMGYPMGTDPGKMSSSVRGMKKMGAAIDDFAKKLLNFANTFKDIFDKYIAPFLYTVLSGFALVLKGVIDVFMGIFNVVKGIYQKIKGEGDGGTAALKEGFEKLKRGVLLVLKGILKMFIVILIPIVNAVFKFVELVVKLFELLGFAIVNVFRYIAKIVISVVTGFVSAFAFVIDKIIGAFVFLQTTVIIIFRGILKIGVNVGTALIKGFIFAVQKILDAFAGLLVGVGNIIGFLPQLIGAIFQNIADKAKNIRFIGKFLAAPAEAIAKGFNAIAGGLDVVTDKAKSGLNGLLDPISKGVDAGGEAIIRVIDVVTEKAEKAYGAIGKIGGFLRGEIADFGDAARDAVDNVADGTNRAIGSASDIINEGRKFIIEWLDSFTQGDEITKGIGEGAKGALDDAIKNTDPSALKAAGEDITKAIQEGLKNVKMNFFEKVIDNLSKALEKQKNKLADALNLQKDNQLKIFDDQIAAIDALAAAEEKLTATIEFENKKREAEAERSLQRKNYEKQRALAIYEGRIDDARTLDQEETKNRKDAEKNLQDMQTDRNKTLQGEQRDTAKTIIGQQKTKAAETFDKDIKAFEEFAANVLSKGTFTQAELESQFAEISNKASEMSLNMRDSFSSFYTALPGLISANTEPTVGFFNTSLQTLVDAAKAKFGLDAEVSGDTILGSTALMLDGSTAMFAEKMPLVLGEYKKGTDSLAQVGIDFANPDNENSPGRIYGKAIADANAAMLREFMKMKEETGSAFAEVIKGLNSQIKDIAVADAIKAATKDLKKIGTGSEEIPKSSIGSADANTTVSYPTLPSNLTPGQKTLAQDALSGASLAAGFNPFATVSSEYMNQFADGVKSPAQNKSLTEFKNQVKPLGFFQINSKGALVSNIKKALKFYGYDTGNTTDTFGPGAVTATAQFQEKYAISPVDGKVGEKTARALGLFSASGMPKRYYGGPIKRMMGGPIGAYGAGGTVPGFAMKAVPALLHGGEYVVNAKAVQNLGSGFLQYINNLKNGMPRFGIPTPNMPNVNINQTVNVNGGNSENINNYNFYVDNFIGEDKWFEGMMNEYNVKVVPNKQKSAGLESRVVRSYNGINKGN